MRDKYIKADNDEFLEANGVRVTTNVIRLGIVRFRRHAERIHDEYLDVLRQAQPLKQQKEQAPSEPAPVLQLVRSSPGPDEPDS